MRLVILRLLLSCMLLGTQQMGWTHAFSHWGRGAGGIGVGVTPATTESAARKASAPPQAEKLCEQCLAFAQIDAALADSRSGATAEAIPATEGPHALRDGVQPLHTRVFQSRAPPPLL